MIRFSFLNLAEAASIAASTTFTEAETGVGLRFPARPHLRGFSVDLSGGRATFDFGTATAPGVVALVNANFTSATIQGNATDVWSGPSYAQAIAIGPAGNDRYHYAHRPTTPAFSYRYLSVAVSTGIATDGLARFAFGGLWAGAITSPPRDILMGPEESKLEARQDIETEDGRRIARIIYDDPAWSVTCKRLAETEAELAAWKAIDRQWSAAPGQAALVMFRDAYPEECYVMRQVSVSKWVHERIWMSSEMELLEVTSG